MTADDVKALGLPSDKTVSTATINKHITFLNGMFKHAVNLEYIPSSPASDMQVPEPKGGEQTVDEFSQDDLIKIFNSPVLGKNYPYQFWIPVLGLYTGARREELCNLYREDIKQEEGIWYIDINMDKPDKFIKTYQSRKVPLHPFLLDLGFLDYIKGFQPGERIWPELSNNNKSKKYGHYFGRWFNNSLLNPLGIKPTANEIGVGALKKTFHSFRHSLITLGIRSGMDVQKVKGLVGHQEKGVTFGTYFKGYTVRQIYDEIVSQIDFGIDLSHLKNSKWVTKE